MQPGTIITDIEGLDLGPQGAVVVSVDGDQVELAVLDTKEFVTVDLSKADYHAEEPVEPEGVTPSGYDPEALNSPELHTIRWLPTYWGPRDPNNPSSLTDVSWRPSPYWRRMMNRHYSVGPLGGTRMTYRRPYMRKYAEPLPSMDPLPQSQPEQTHLQRDYGLPRRMRLDRWEEPAGAVLDTDALIAMTLDFWQQYRKKRITYMPEMGNRLSMTLRDWGLMYLHRTGMERDEMMLLYQFMVDTELIPLDEMLEFEDLLDTYAVFRYHRS